MGFLETNIPVGETVSLLREDGQAERFPVGAAPAAGTVVQTFGGQIVFNMVNGLQAFVVAVAGVLAGDVAWASLDGQATSSGGNELVAVGGCYVSAPGQVTLLATYPGASSSVTVPIRIFWYTP